MESVVEASGAHVVLAGTTSGKSQPVVIEVLVTSPENADAARIRFLAEARKAAGVMNVHVSRVLHVGVTSDGHPFAVREAVDDGTLAALLFEEPAMPTEHAVDVALDICDALAEAHALGVFHGALSPASVHLGYSVIGPAFVKLTGLGTAHVMTELGYAPGGLPVPLLRAPEILRRADSFDARADVWGVGVILYTMLAGSPPFVNETPSTTDLSIAWEEPASLAGVPDALAEVVDACLGKDPAMRPATVLALADKLLQFSSNPAEALARVVARSSTRRSSPPPAQVASSTSSAAGASSARKASGSYVARREVAASARIEIMPSLVLETGQYKAVELERLVEDARPSAAQIEAADELDSGLLEDSAELDIHVSVRDLEGTQTREVAAVADPPKAPSVSFPKAAPVVVTAPMTMPQQRPVQRRPSSIAPTAMSIPPANDTTAPMHFRAGFVRGQTLSADLAPPAKESRRLRVASGIGAAAFLAIAIFMGFSSRDAASASAPTAAAAPPPAMAAELPPAALATEAPVAAPAHADEVVSTPKVTTPSDLPPPTVELPATRPAAQPAPARAAAPAHAAAPSPARAEKSADDDLRKFLDDRR